jgi:hypothetical protein
MLTPKKVAKKPTGVIILPKMPSPTIQPDNKSDVVISLLEKIEVPTPTSVPVKKKFCILWWCF